MGAGQQVYAMVIGWCPPATHTGAFSTRSFRFYFIFLYPTTNARAFSTRCINFYFKIRDKKNQAWFMALAKESLRSSSTDVEL
jgi:hypothetical protein